MKEVKIESRSLCPDKRTKVMIGRHDYARDISALIYIMQVDKPNTLITVTHPKEFDLVAAIKEEQKTIEAKTFAGKIMETIKGTLDGPDKKSNRRSSH